MLSLEHDDVHVWTLAVSAAGALLDGLHDDPESWLGQRELDRLRRLQIRQRRRSYLLGKVFMRLVLSRYQAIEPGQWRFLENAHGKPSIDPQQLSRPLYFNLSHSRNRLVLAVSRCHYTGIDVEYSSRQRRVSRLVDRYFSAPETDWLSRLTPARQQQAFYQLWTLKEAYIKARGLGLALALDSFSFDLAQAQQIGFQQHDADSALALDWRFWRLRDPEADFDRSGEEYALALGLAADTESQAGVGAIRITSRRLHVEQEDEEVATVVLATSG